jgi:hypothetical protein
MSDRRESDHRECSTFPVRSSPRSTASVSRSADVRRGAMHVIEDRAGQPPRISARGDRDGDHLSPPTYPGTLCAKRKNLEDRAVEESCEEDHIDVFFVQLWSIPQPPEKARVSNQEINRGHLVWVRRDLVSREIKPEDCFPVGRHERIVDKPTDSELLVRYLGTGRISAYLC